MFYDLHGVQLQKFGKCATAIGYQAIVTCLVSVFIVCIFRSIYAPTPDLEPIIERMSKSRDGER